MSLAKAVKPQMPAFGNVTVSESGTPPLVTVTVPAGVPPTGWCCGNASVSV